MLLTSKRKSFYCGVVGKNNPTNAEMFAYIRWFLRVDPNTVEIDSLVSEERMGIVVEAKRAG